MLIFFQLHKPLEDRGDLRPCGGALGIETLAVLAEQDTPTDRPGHGVGGPGGDVVGGQNRGRVNADDLSSGHAVLGA